jgi:hypothetical protein
VRRPVIRVTRRASSLRPLASLLLRFPQARWRALILSERHVIVHVWVPRKERNAPQD